MKWLVFIGLLLPPLPKAPTVPVRFQFRYPTNSLSQVRFIAYATPIISLPLTNWHVLSIIEGTNVTIVGGQRNVQFSTSARSMDRFFVLAASNNVGVVFNK